MVVVTIQIEKFNFVCLSFFFFFSKINLLSSKLGFLKCQILLFNYWRLLPVKCLMLGLSEDSMYDCLVNNCDFFQSIFNITL